MRWDTFSWIRLDNILTPIRQKLKKKIIILDDNVNWFTYSPLVALTRFIKTGNETQIS